MTAATTRLWVPNLWLPRTEFRLRRSRSIEDDQTFVRLDSGVAVESHVLTTGAGPSLPIGGDPSLRGVKAFTFQTANQIVSGTAQADILAAIAAAPTGGVVRLPNPVVYPGFSVNKRTTIEIHPGATINGGISHTAAAGASTIEGGQVNGTVTLPRGAAGSLTLRNVTRQGGGQGMLIEGRVSLSVINCEFYGQANDPIRMFYDNPADPDMDGVLIENCIMVRTSGSEQSMVSGKSEDNPESKPNAAVMKNFRMKNNYVDGGTYAQGHFGIEVWNCEYNGSGIGGILEHNDIRGGKVHVSMVASRGNWVYRNWFSINTGFAVYEAAGPSHTGLTFELNRIFGLRGPGIGAVIWHGTSSHHNIVRQNHATDLLWLVDGAGTGGAYTVEDNRAVNVSNIIQPNSAWALPNIVNNNCPTCGSAL